MTLARALSLLSASHPGIRPERHEITVWGHVAGDECADTTGALIVHPDGIALSQPPELLSGGFTVAVPYADIALAQWNPERFEVHLIRAGKVRKFIFRPSPETLPNHLAEAALRMHLRMTGIVPAGADWPAVPLPDIGPEKAAEAARTLSGIAQKFSAHPGLICWQAALLNASDNARDAIEVLAGHGERLGDPGRFMMIVSLVCARRISIAEALQNEIRGEISGIPLARDRLRLLCRLHRTRRETEWPGWLEQLCLAPALRDCCLEPAWPSLRKALIAPGIVTLESVAALLEDDPENASRLLDAARRESWFDPLPSMLVEASCLALEGEFGFAFLRLWPARGRAAAMPLICLALASGNEFMVSGWLDTAPNAVTDLAADERIILAHFRLRTGKPEMASSLLAGLTGEYRSSLRPEISFRLSIIECLLDRDVKREKAERCLGLLNGPGDLSLHPEALRFAAELRIILSSAEAALDHQRDARVEMMRASSLIGASGTDPLWMLLEERRKQTISDPSPSSWKEVAGIVGKLVLSASEARRGELAALWKNFESGSARPLTIAFIGEFNAGKSSLINAVLQRNLLPAGVLPTTRLPCAIEDSPVESLISIIRGGGFRSSTLESLGGLLEERHDSRAMTQDACEQIHLFIRMPDFSSLRILDLPGLNARLVRHQTVSEAAVVEADIIVWVDNASQFSSASNAVSRARLVRSWQTLVPVLNRVDEIDADERDGVVSAWLEKMGDLVKSPPFVTACHPESRNDQGLKEFSAWLAVLNASAGRIRAQHRKARLLDFLAQLRDDIEASLARLSEALHSGDVQQSPERMRISDTTVHDIIGRLARRITDWNKLAVPVTALSGLVRKLLVETLETGAVGQSGIDELVREMASGTIPDFSVVRSICDTISRETSALHMRAHLQDKARRRWISGNGKAELAIKKMMFQTPLLEVTKAVSDEIVPDLPWR